MHKQNSNHADNVSTKNKCQAVPSERYNTTKLTPIIHHHTTQTHPKTHPKKYTLS